MTEPETYRWTITLELHDADDQPPPCRAIEYAVEKILAATGTWKYTLTVSPDA